MLKILALFFILILLPKQPKPTQSTPSPPQIMPTEAQIQAAKNKLIVVTLSKKTLEYFENDKLIKKYHIGIGKPKTPSPVGEGYIRCKGQMVFEYDSGPRKGKIIRYTQLENGEWIKMPYKKMLGLGIIIPGYDPLQYYVHATVNNAAIGNEISKGCIRLTIPDMQEFYPLVPVGTRIIIKK